MVVKVFDPLLEGCEFDSHVHQAAAAGPLSQAPNPQSISCIKWDCKSLSIMASDGVTSLYTFCLQTNYTKGCIIL